MPKPKSKFNSLQSTVTILQHDIGRGSGRATHLLGLSEDGHFIQLAIHGCVGPMGHENPDNHIGRSDLSGL